MFRFLQWPRLRELWRATDGERVEGLVVKTRLCNIPWNLFLLRSLTIKTLTHLSYTFFLEPLLWNLYFGTRNYPVHCCNSKRQENPSDMPTRYGSSAGKAVQRWYAADNYVSPLALPIEVSPFPVCVTKSYIKTRSSGER